VRPMPDVERVDVEPRDRLVDVTVVIPTTGTPILEGCLASIVAGTKWPARLIVVDQGQRRAVADRLTALRAVGLDAVHVPSSQTGIAAATNRGLERVETDLVAVTHDDCLVRPSWLERLVERLADERTGGLDAPHAGDVILTGRVEPEGDGIVLTVKTDARPSIHTVPTLTSDVLFPPNMAFPLRVLDRVGPFDEHPSLATAGEDNEWAHRALRAGVPIVYDPSVVVAHLARHQPRDVGALYGRYARGQGAFYGTWLRRGDPLIARRVARDLLRAPWLFARGLATRNEELVAMGRAELTGLPPGILAGLRNPGVRGVDG
jgi:GT2 family glycosyltransferase